MLKITNENEFLQELMKEVQVEQKKTLVRVIKGFSNNSIYSKMSGSVSAKTARMVRNPAPNPLRKILPGENLSRSVDFRGASNDLLSRAEARNPAGYYETQVSQNAVQVTLYSNVVSKGGFRYGQFHVNKGRDFFFNALGEEMDRIPIYWNR